MGMKLSTTAPDKPELPHKTVAPERWPGSDWRHRGKTAEEVPNSQQLAADFARESLDN